MVVIKRVKFILSLKMPSPRERQSSLGGLYELMHYVKKTFMYIYLYVRSIKKREF